jgi:hypothetical protein
MRKWRARSDYKLKKAAETVDFECESFFNALFWNIGAKMLGENQEAAKRAFAQATQEAWLLHMRNLMQFFNENPRWKEDVLARDYLTGPAWKKCKKKLVPGKKAKQRIHDISTFLAHISYDRTRLARRAKWTKKDHDWVHDRLRTWFDALEPRWQKRFPRLEAWLSGSRP